MDQRFLRQQIVLPTELGLNGVTLASERTSNNIDLRGVSELAVYVNHTNSAATQIDVNLDVTPEGDLGSTVSNWFESQAVEVSTGTATLSDLDIQKAVSGSKKFEVRFENLNAITGRLRISSTGGGASDTVIVTAIKAHV